MTRVQAVRLWRSEVLPIVKARYECDGIPDYPARSESWGEFTDSLCKDRQITAKQYHEWSAPKECGK